MSDPDLDEPIDDEALWDADLLAEVGDAEEWLVDLDEEDREILGPEGIVPGFEYTPPPETGPKYQLSDLLGFRHGRVRKSVRYSEPPKAQIVKTLVLFNSDSMPGTDLYLCSRCNEVTLGKLPEGIHAPCPRCTCAIDVCYQPHGPQDVFCAQHRADQDIVDSGRINRRNSLWMARLLEDDPVELESFVEEPVYDPHQGEFYESFEDWARHQNENWLKRMPLKEHLLLPCKSRQMINPFSQENLELMAEDAWGDLNPLIDDPHFQFVVKSLADLSKRVAPYDIFRNARLRIEPADEYIRYAKWKAEQERLAQEERDRLAREACECPDCLAHGRQARALTPSTTSGDTP